MRFIEEKLSTPIDGEYDVIVVGAGPAGSCAAISAARQGAKTMLIEKMMYMGGMWTAGFVNPLFDFHKKGGILAELIADLDKIGSWGGFIDSCFGFENMKRLLEEKYIAAGGELLYLTDFAKTLVDENNRVYGIIAQNKSGRHAYLAKVVIDCTGDADVAFDAGVKTFTGRESDNACQAMTLMFTIGNVNFIQSNCDELAEMIDEALKKNDTSYRLPYRRPYIIQIPNSCTACVQLTHIRRKNPLSPSDITDAAIDGRRQAYEVVEFLRHNVERFRDIELLETAPLMGVRESRRIDGEYTLTKEDLATGRHFEDDITSAAFGIDIHDPFEDTQQVYPVKPYGIPYRCLIPRDYHGLLVAGRCISGTSEAMASYRVTGNCAAMGERAGFAAASAAMTDKDVRYAKIR